MKWKGEAAALPELSARPAHPRSASQGRGGKEVWGGCRAPVQQGPQLVRGPVGAPEEGPVSTVQHVVCLVAGDASERQTPEGRRRKYHRNICRPRRQTVTVSRINQRTVKYFIFLQFTSVFRIICLEQFH